MQEKFNKQVFESFPDSVWNGDMPDLSGKSSVSTFAKYIYNAAAVISIPFAVLTLVFSAIKDKPVETASEPVAMSEIVYRVNRATQADIFLPDSTHVILSSGSELRLAQDFGTGTRTVSLNGEGYFDVHRDLNCPFYINTPQGIEVKVTGTRFNMSCFSDMSKFDLTLLQGSVEVKTRNKEVLHVAPSEQVLIKDDFHNISVVENPAESLAWTEGILRFDNTSMREAISRIEKWYGVDIVVEDESVYNHSISAEFHSETLNEVLQLLSFSSKLEYTLNGSEVLLKPRS